MQVEEVDVSSLKAYEKNPRKNEEGVKAVALSITEYGFRNPLLVDEDNTIVAGHTRYLAAKELGMTKVPVIRIDNLTPAQIKAFRIADNRTHEFAEWDLSLLVDEIQELRDDGYDTDLTFFSGEDLSKMITEMDEFMPPEDDSDKDSPDTVRMPSTKYDGTGQLGLTSLKFGNIEVPMSVEEGARLERVYKNYVQVNKNNFGFPSYLMEGRD